jgi:hypothetical protein
MGGKTRVEDLKVFDMADQLDSPEAVAQYLEVVLEENDSGALIEAWEKSRKRQGWAGSRSTRRWRAARSRALTRCTG